MDILSDQLFDGRKIRIMTIADAFSKLLPAINVRFRYTGANVVATLKRVASQYGVPHTIRLDNGPEFVSRALALWPIGMELSSTSRGPARRPTTLISKPSAVVSGRNV